MIHIMKKLSKTLIPKIQKQVPLVQLIQANQFSDMPTASQLFSKEYFEFILKMFYKNDNVKVDEVKAGNRSSLQQSFMTEVNKWTLFGFKEDGKFQLDVIVKALHSRAHQDLYNSHIAAKNEEIAYNTIFPHLNIFGETALPVPVCYSAKPEQIIVQDLCGVDQNYKMFDKKKGHIVLNECMYILQALAKFHAATFAFKHQNIEAFKNIKNLTKEFLYSYPNSPLLKHQQDSLKSIVSLYKRRYPTEENVTKIAALENLIKVAKYDIKDLLSEEQDNNVFCHGDLLLTNILYKLKEKKNKNDLIVDIDIKFIDFQKVLYSSVASDLVYPLFINLMPDDYIDFKECFLKNYLYYLKSSIADNGVTIDPKLNYNWLKNEVDRFTEYGIISALWVLPMFSSNDNQDRKEVTKEMLDESSKNIFFNKRMEKWVDYYSEIFDKRSEE